jgi:hypothetical protein
MNIKWILNSEGYIVDFQTGEMICLMAKNSDKLRDKMVEVAPEMFQAIVSFVQSMDNGKSAIKSAYNEFKGILERIPNDVMEDERVKEVA